MKAFEMMRDGMKLSDVVKAIGIPATNLTRDFKDVSGLLPKQYQAALKKDPKSYFDVKKNKNAGEIPNNYR